MTGQPPMKGGPAATARSIHHKQQNFVNKAAEISTKPTEFVTQEDARELQAAEVRFYAPTTMPRMEDGWDWIG